MLAWPASWLSINDGGLKNSFCSFCCAFVHLSLSKWLLHLFYGKFCNEFGRKAVQNCNWSGFSNRIDSLLVANRMTLIHWECSLDDKPAYRIDASFLTSNFLDALGTLFKMSTLETWKSKVGWFKLSLTSSVLNCPWGIKWWCSWK